MGTNKNIIRIFSVVTLFLAISLGVKAEGDSEGVGLTVGADLVSSYIWRGQELGGASVQPTMSVNYKGFSIGAWGSAGFDKDDNKEIDLTIGYENGGFSVGITDYWISGNASFFHYKAFETAHVFEGNIGYDFGVLAINWNTVFAGADYFQSDGSRSYSSYFQMDVPFVLAGLDCSAELGVTPYCGAYADGFSVVNVSLGAAKTIEITDKFSLPVFAKLTANPSTESMFFAFGVTF